MESYHFMETGFLGSHFSTAAIRVGELFVLKGSSHPLQQMADLEALKSILEFESPNTPLVIFTFSDWTAKTFSIWLSVQVM